MDPLQNIRNVSKNLYDDIKLDEMPFVGKTINIHDVANQTKCNIGNPPTTNLCLHHDKRKIININNIENNLNVGIDESCNIINISNCNIDYI